MDANFIRERFAEIAKLRKFSHRWLSESLRINRYSICQRALKNTHP